MADALEAAKSMGDRDVSDGGEGTTFMQWRERAQAEVRDGEPRLRKMLITAGVVVVAGIVLGVIVLLLS
ncbi:hypothetical protein GCM10027563_00740 [Parasphingorhabdus pacifica]